MVYREDEINLDVVATATWRVPVYVRIGYGGSESIQSASEVLIATEN